MTYLCLNAFSTILRMQEIELNVNFRPRAEGTRTLSPCCVRKREGIPPVSEGPAVEESNVELLGLRSQSGWDSPGSGSLGDLRKPIPTLLQSGQGGPCSGRPGGLPVIVLGTKGKLLVGP
jgi:hypothetical protein